MDFVFGNVDVDDVDVEEQEDDAEIIAGAAEVVGFAGMRDADSDDASKDSCTS
jgi:hypothetical protein